MKKRIATTLAAAMLLAASGNTAYAIYGTKEQAAQLDAAWNNSEAAKNYEKWKQEQEALNPEPTAASVPDVAVPRTDIPVTQDAEPIITIVDEPEKVIVSYYDDVPTDAWYAEAIAALTEGGLMNGYSDGLFHPDDLITQGQFAKILVEIYGLKPEPLTTVCKAYCDFYGWQEGITMDRHWALPYAWTISATGEYLLPLGGQTLDNPVWRGDALYQMYLTTWHINKYYDYWAKVENDKDRWRQHSEKVWTEADIPDWDVVAYDAGKWHLFDTFLDGVCSPRNPDWMDYAGHYFDKESILQMYNSGITKGVDAEGTCNPFGTLTRAELCQMLYNAGITKAGSVRN